MEKVILTIPTLYGDHHTTAVRTILEALPGVSDLYVSAAFHQVSLALDPARTSPQALEAALAEHGYIRGVEEPAYAVGFAERATRHTAAMAGTGSALAFAERTQVADGRALWPCPGFDPRTPHPVA